MSMYDAEHIMYEIRGLEVKMERLRTNVAHILEGNVASNREKELLIRSTTLQLLHDCMPHVTHLNSCEVSWYDEFDVEMMETVSIIKCVDRVREETQVEGIHDVDLVYTKEQADHIINQLLSCGYTHFKYDC